MYSLWNGVREAQANRLADPAVKQSLPGHSGEWRRAVTGSGRTNWSPSDRTSRLYSKTTAYAS